MQVRCVIYLAHQTSRGKIGGMPQLEIGMQSKLLVLLLQMQFLGEYHDHQLM